MFWRMTKAVLILPGTALIYIPILVQCFSDQWPFGASVGTRLHWAVAAMLAVPALALAANTMKLFVLEGYGTPAPWDPPQRFVVSGPYRYVRNPMLSSFIINDTSGSSGNEQPTPVGLGDSVLSPQHTLLQIRRGAGAGTTLWRGLPAVQGEGAAMGSYVSAV